MESTVIRQVSMTAMLVGEAGVAADKVASHFEASEIEVVRVAQAASACERLAVVMPQVVIVLGTLRDEERDALHDRATAVGALLLNVDPEIDDASLDELTTRAAREAVTRKLLRDGEARAAAELARGAEEESVDVEMEIDVDVDSQW